MFMPPKNAIPKKALWESLETPQQAPLCLDVNHLSLDFNEWQKLESRVQSCPRIGHIESGVVLGESQAVRTRIEKSLIERNAKYRYYPLDYVYGLLSLHVYRDSLVGDAVSLGETASDQWLAGWKVNRVFKEEWYYAVLYENTENSQMILAHRGLDFKFKKLAKGSTDITASIKGIVAGALIGQQALAYYFTSEAWKTAEKNNCSFSVTGHWLGAYLAELSAYYCQFDFKGEVKAVTFDSPGTLTMFKQHESNVLN